MMYTGVNVFKRTDNLSESEPRMTSAWKRSKQGQLFQVPLHDNDQQYVSILSDPLSVCKTKRHRLCVLGRRYDTPSQHNGDQASKKHTAIHLFCRANHVACC